MIRPGRNKLLPQKNLELLRQIKCYGKQMYIQFQSQFFFIHGNQRQGQEVYNNSHTLTQPIELDPLDILELVQTRRLCQLTLKGQDITGRNIIYSFQLRPFCSKILNISVGSRNCNRDKILKEKNTYIEKKVRCYECWGYLSLNEYLKVYSLLNQS